MRVWLVRSSDANSAALESVLKELEKRPETGLRLLGISTHQLDGAESLEQLAPETLDLLVLHEGAWSEASWIGDLLNLGVAMVVATDSNRVERFRSLATSYPLSFVPSVPGREELWLALWTALAARQRQLQWKNQVERLQQRLNDRIVIERAKGILVERLKITEEDAYKRLRVLSRRQRRQIRDIAQSLLDTQFLFNFESNGNMKNGGMESLGVPQERPNKE